MTKDQPVGCREAFEAWVVNVPGYGSFRTAKRGDDGRYDSSHTHLMWLAFRAGCKPKMHPAYRAEFWREFERWLTDRLKDAKKSPSRSRGRARSQRN